MKEFKVLKVLDKISGLYKKFGVDYEVLRLILNAKLTMDGRRKATVFNNNNSKRKKKDEDSNQFYKALILYAFMGLFLGIMLIFDINKMYMMAVYFSAIMFMVLTIFISDFSYVILDIRDKNIISTKGVDSKTINAAKITHVFLYMLYLTIALAGASLLVSFKYGIAYFLIFLIEIILIDIFMIIITALAYLLVLKFFDGEKLKDLINFVQIVLSIFIIVMYQVIPRLFEFVNLSDINYKEKLWHFLVPPMWFAAPLSIVYGEGVTYLKVIMCILAFIVPVISIFIYLKLTPAFERNLQKLNNNDDKVKEKVSFLIKINNFFCKDNTERAFFNFSIGIMNSEREFKLKIYPNLALGIVLPIIFLITGIDRNNPEGVFEGLRNSKLYLSIYAFSFIIPNIIIMLRYSERYLGAWIYEVAPIKNKSAIFRGVLKGAIYKFILMPYLVISAIYIFIFGPKVIIHLIIAILVFILLMILNFMKLSKVLPFSKKFEATNSGESVAAMFLYFFCIIVAVAIHFMISKFIIWQFIFVVILLLMDLYLWKFSLVVPKEKLKN